MSWVEDRLKDFGNAVVDVVTGVADLAGDVVKGVGKAISGVVDFGITYSTPLTPDA